MISINTGDGHRPADEEPQQEAESGSRATGRGRPWWLVFPDDAFRLRTEREDYPGQIADYLRQLGVEVEPRAWEIVGAEGAGEELASAPAMISSEAPLPTHPAAARRYALSRMWAAEAMHDAQVERFRRRHLGATDGALLKWTEVSAWIDKVCDAAEEADEDGPSFWLSGVPISQAQITEGQRRAQDGYTHLEVTVPLPWEHSGPPEAGNLQERRLEFLLPDGPLWPASSSSVTAGGVLDQLRRVSERLSVAYPFWRRAQSTIFILTGLAPLVAVVDAIVLRVDQLASPRDVADAFLRVRRQLGYERRREMSHKHLELAIFIAERAPAEPWRERLAAWNAAFPDWAYPAAQLANFTRDYHQARRRLLMVET